jgi:two-component sensor histidine kinase
VAEPSSKSAPNAAPPPERGHLVADAAKEPTATARRDEHVQRLEGELRLLQATIEELQNTKAELKSANEELHTVNGELAHRVNELTRANSDLKNLLESTQIATLSVENDLREAQAALRDRTRARDAEDRQKLLMGGLQHRVKNILAVVRSIAARTQETSPDLESFAAHFDGRLGALSRTQSVLARNVAGRIDLEELVRDELLSHAAHDEDQIDVEGPPVRLRDRAADIFALALHELATNAVKYGALSSPKGRVTVRWRILNTSAGARLTLDWRESGVAVLDSQPRRRGFGRELLEQGLPYELGAATSLEFAPGGIRCTIEIPVPLEDAQFAVAG